MGENPVDPEVIKRTQDTLGQIISAPALTEKLLSRPPVQFLQDIVKAVGNSIFPPGGEKSRVFDSFR